MDSVGAAGALNLTGSATEALGAEATAEAASVPPHSGLAVLPVVEPGFKYDEAPYPTRPAVNASPQLPPASFVPTPAPIAVHVAADHVDPNAVPILGATIDNAIGATFLTAFHILLKKPNSCLPVAGL